MRGVKFPEEKKLSDVSPIKNTIEFTKMPEQSSKREVWLASASWRTSKELRQVRVKKLKVSAGSSPWRLKVCQDNPSDGARLAHSCYHCLLDLLMAGFQHNLLCHICSSSSHRSLPSPFFSWKLQQRSYLVSPPSLSSIALMHLVRLSVSETHFWISEPSRVCWSFFFLLFHPPPPPPNLFSSSPLVPSPVLLRW